MKKLTFFLMMLLCAAALANEHSIAVYVTGDLSGNEKKVLGTELLKAFERTGRLFMAVDCPAFASEIEKAPAALEGAAGVRDSAAADDDLICSVGREFGAWYVCVVDVTQAFGFHLLSARLLRAESAKLLLLGEADGPLNSMQAIETLSNSLVKNMGFQMPDPGSAPGAGAARAPSAAPAAQAPSGMTPEESGRTRQPAPAASAAYAPPPAAPAAPKGPVKIAVYITGAGLMSKPLSAAISKALIASKIYAGVEDISEFMRGGGSGDSQIGSAGRKAGVSIVCVIDAAGGQIAIRMIDAETAAAMAKISLNGKMNSMLDVGLMSKKIIEFILSSSPKPAAGAAAQASHGAQGNPTARAPAREYTYGYDSEPEAKTGNRFSWGAGFFFSNDFGGGLTWKNSSSSTSSYYGSVGMPYLGGGFYSYFDFIYTELFFAYSWGGGEWETNNYTSYKLPDMERSLINLGVFFKIPVTVGSSGNSKWFPILGFDIEWAVAANLVYPDGSRYALGDNDGLSALWFKIGSGFDIGLGDNAYLRFEYLYGWRTSNGFERNYYSADYSAEPRSGHGQTIRFGIGVKFGSSD